MFKIVYINHAQIQKLVLVKITQILMMITVVIIKEDLCFCGLMISNLGLKIAVFKVVLFYSIISFQNVQHDHNYLLKINKQNILL